MDPFVLLIVGGVGLAGCVILLLLGLNMLREERAPKDGTAADPAVPSIAAPSLAGSGTAAPEPAAPKPEAAQPAGGTGLGAALAGVTARFTGGAARGGAHEVLRVLRDNLTGRLVLEIAGKRYASLDDVGQGDVRQALLAALHDLEAFSGGAVGLTLADRPADPPTGTAARQALANRAAPAAPAEYRPLPPPSMNPFKQMVVLREMAKNPPPVLKTITEQIDDVLQERIIGTPLIHRSLHVRPGLRGDAIFEADGQTYQSVDQVPDVEVRDIIRAAIADWEKKQ